MSRGRLKKPTRNRNLFSEQTIQAAALSSDGLGVPLINPRVQTPTKGIPLLQIVSHHERRGSLWRPKPRTARLPVVVPSTPEAISTIGRRCELVKSR